MPPEQNPQQRHQSGELKRIHTYESDVEDLMQNKSVSKTDIALAESERRRSEPADNSNARANQPRTLRISSDLPMTSPWNLKLIAFVGAVAFILAGIGVGAFLLFRDRAPVPQKEAPPTVLKSAEAVLTGTESRAGAIKVIRTALETASVPQNQLRTIPLRRGAAVLTTAELFNILETSAPPALIRALSASLTLGIHGFKGGQPFLLFSVSSYDHAFSGMFSWEETILDDVGPLFGVLPREILRESSDTTTEARDSVIAFKDTIIRNKDARAAFTQDGRIIFLYSFPDKQTLIFATNEDTLKFLMSKAGGGRLK